MRARIIGKSAAAGGHVSLRFLVPAALFRYSADRKGEHPRAHLNEFTAVIHVDGYSGFNELFAGKPHPRSWVLADVRRKFFDVHAAIGSPIANEALDRIGQIHGVEETIKASRPNIDDENASSAPSRSPRTGWLGRPDRVQAVGQIRTCRGLPLYARSPSSTRPLL